MKIFKVFQLTTFVFILVAPILLSAASDHGSISGASNALSGSYEIGGGGADFVDLEAAVSKILNVGMDAPVVFNLKPGTYNTHVIITHITRHGQYNDWLTIQSEDPNNPAVLQHDASSSNENWLIRFDGTKFITLQNLILEAVGVDDFTTVISLENNSSYIDIINNEINGYAISNAAPDAAGYLLVNQADTYLNNILIYDNEFNGGNGAIKLEGNPTGYISGVSVIGNDFNNQTALGSFYALTLYKVKNLTILSNQIMSNAYNAGGMRLFRVDEAVVAANRISMLGAGSGGVGLSLSNTNRGLNETIVVKNNFILASHSPLEIQGNNTRNISVFHNTLMADGSVAANTFPAPLSVDASTENIIIQNNILTSLQTDDSAFAMIIEDSGTVTLSDNNIFYHASLNEFLIDGVAYANLIDYQNGTGMDSDSSHERIQFVDEAIGDFHLTSAQYQNPTLLTQPIAGVDDDIDGELRSDTTPLKGADDLDADVIFVHGFE